MSTLTLLRGAPRLLHSSLVLCKQPILQRSSLQVKRHGVHSTATSHNSGAIHPGSSATAMWSGQHESLVDAKKDSLTSDVKPSLHKVYVGNLPEGVDSVHLKAEFQKYGAVIRAKILERGSPVKRFGFVKFSTAESAQKAIEDANGQRYEGRILVVQAIDPSRSAAKRPSTNTQAPLPRSRNLFVGGLPQNVSQDMLWTMFSKHGVVDSVHLPTRKKRTLANGFTFAFVSYNKQSDAEKAIKALNSTKMEGSVIKVTHVKTPWRWPSTADGGEPESR